MAKSHIIDPFEFLNAKKEDEEKKEPTSHRISSFGSYLAWKLFEQRVIPIYFDIYDEAAEIVSAQLIAMSAENKKPITIELHTHGGSVFAGFAVFDEIISTRKKGIPVNIVVKGLTASMGVVILQAATERIMTEHSKLMIHEISQLLVQTKTASEIKERVVELEKLTDMITNILGKRMGKTKKQVTELIRKTDVWYGPKEAKASGLVDKIIKCTI